eukprot:10819189-Alexandrium_andersonii.AAC.1
MCIRDSINLQLAEPRGPEEAGLAEALSAGLLEWARRPLPMGPTRQGANGGVLPRHGLRPGIGDGGLGG